MRTEQHGVTQRERDSLAESDPHALLFGHDEDELHGSHHSHLPGQVTRSQRRHALREHSKKRRRNGRLMVLLAVLIIGVVGSGAYVWVRKAVEVKDYSGTGTTPVTIVVHSGDSAADIAATLKKADVVQSVAAFTNAANADDRSKGIQPGTYTLRKHMSGKAALTLLLDPTSRNADRDVLITEGATSMDVASSIAKALGVSVASVRKAMADVGSLALPSTYTVGNQPPPSVEGFLFPATYTLEAGTKIDDALSQMINAFIDQDRSTGFTAKAKSVKLTPYQALIIASIAQSEAKFADDLPKVVRVILNRIAAGRPLQIDATSLYGARVMGLDPHKVIYSELDSPYNTYKHAGLTPTPISNPGAQAMAAAVAPAQGDWLYYVNGDKDGHLYFTNNEDDFLQAVEKCRANNWGCG